MAGALPLLLKGFWVTLEVSAGGLLLALVVAFWVGTAGLMPWRSLRWLAWGYVEFFRGTSLLVQLFWLYFVLPFFGVELSALLTAILGLGLHIGAYGAEVVRGALLSLPKGQFEAAQALGLNLRQTMVRVIWPQAFPVMLPSLGNLSIELTKASSLVSLITLADLTFQAQSLRNATFATGPIFGLVLVFYFLLSSLLAWGSKKAERQFAWRRHGL
ncbi:MAG: ectoine/hydroxyectoine ABC transporter permease subunit EhuC [bacterium]|nr:ectoine/hydroxyectoine ABC transporter permease subunit EhuC [bacterium]